jgi:hypothetical protein
MDAQDQQPRSPNQTTNQPPVEVSPKVAPATSQPTQPQPKPHMSKDEALALLTINNLDGSHHSTDKSPNKLLLIAIGLIVFAIVITYLFTFLKSKGTTNSSGSGGLGLPSQSTSTSQNGTSSQINQDEKACSNPLNAATVC